MYDQGLTLKEASTRLGYSYQTLRRLVLDGKVHAYGQGKLTRIPSSEIIRFMSFGQQQAGIQNIRPANHRNTRAAISELEQMGIL